MVKRPRGKQAQKLKQRAQEVKDTEKNLESSTWDALDSDAEDPGFSDNDSDQEQDYENRPRKFQHTEDEEVERLPVKTDGGKVQRVIEKSRKQKKEESESEEESEDEEEEEQEEEEEEEDDVDKVEVVDKKTEAELINQAKERIAELAESLAEDPEDNIGKLKEVREMIQRSKLFKVKRLTILALVQIFKDSIPAYRISPLSESQRKEKVSKEVRQLRQYEQSLLANYKEYVDTLAKLAKKSRNTERGSVRYILGASAVTAACELIESVPHFNYRNDLVHLVIDKVSSKRVDKTYERCIKTIEHVFREDDEGQVSFEIVKQLGKMIKARRYKVDPSLISTFLQLRLLTELAAKADLERIEKEKPTGPKIRKKDRKHLNKKERKVRKEQKAIDEEMRIAETAVSAEERERLQGQALKMVFVLYFNILKERSQALMGVTLEGLAKFAHLVNADLFGDLLEVLRELIVERQKRVIENNITEFRETMTREALLCVVTAFALLSGQGVGESMNLDLSFFIDHFYAALNSLALNADIEYSHKTLRLEDPMDPGTFKRAKVNVSTETEMMVRSFESIFFKQRGVGKLRVEAFAKRLSTAMLHLPEKSVIASLRVLDKMNKKYNVMPSMYYTDDRVVNGVYHPESEVPEMSNPEAATIWETLVLEKHYDPAISLAAKSVLRGVHSMKKK